MFAKEQQLLLKVGQLTMQVDAERGEKLQLMGLIRAIKDGSIDPLRITVTDNGVQVAPIEENGKAGEQETREASHLSEVP